MIRLLVIAAALLLAGPARADEIDDYVRSAMERLHIPALSLAVVKDGAVVKAEAYGSIDLEHDVPARADSVFKIGSVSKQFIAAGIMLLVQDGRLSVRDSAAKYIGGLPESWRAITIHHLLTHTSGLARESPGYSSHKLLPDIDVIRAAYALPLLFAPGQKYEYSNLGYFVLGEIISRVSGQPWPAFLHDRIFAPLGMRDTRATTLTEIVPHRARGYAWEANAYRNMEESMAVRPSGAFLSTVLDLAKWETALRTEQILTDRGKAAMWSRVKLNNGEDWPYGYGWQLDDWPADAPQRTGIPMIRHGGTMPGFRANYTRWPSKGLAVIVLTNLEGVELEGLVANIAIRALPELGTR